MEVASSFGLELLLSPKGKFYFNSMVVGAPAHSVVSLAACEERAVTFLGLLSNCGPLALVEQIELLIYLFVLQPVPGLHYVVP